MHLVAAAVEIRRLDYCSVKLGHLLLQLLERLLKAASLIRPCVVDCFVSLVGSFCAGCEVDQYWCEKRRQS